MLWLISCRGASVLLSRVRLPWSRRRCLDPALKYLKLLNVYMTQLCLGCYVNSRVRSCSQRAAMFPHQHLEWPFSATQYSAAQACFQRGDLGWDFVLHVWRLSRINCWGISARVAVNVQLQRSPRTLSFLGKHSRHNPAASTDCTKQKSSWRRGRGSAARINSGLGWGMAAGNMAVYWPDDSEHFMPVNPGLAHVSSNPASPTAPAFAPPESYPAALQDRWLPPEVWWSHSMMDAMGLPYQAPPSNAAQYSPPFLPVLAAWNDAQAPTSWTSYTACALEYPAGGVRVDLSSWKAFLIPLAAHAR